MLPLHPSPPPNHPPHFPACQAPLHPWPHLASYSPTSPSRCSAASAPRAALRPALNSGLTGLARLPHRGSTLSYLSPVSVYLTVSPQQRWLGSSIWVWLTPSRVPGPGRPPRVFEGELGQSSGLPVSGKNASTCSELAVMGPVTLRAGPCAVE